MTVPSSRAALFADFLDELQRLDDFRAEYGQRYRFEGLGRQDQDVQRLIEAMAFYSARTRASAARAMGEYRRRALESLFPYLLSPMPAMALLYPVLGNNMQESRLLPAGAELTVDNADDPRAPPGLFRTLRELEVFPLHVVQRSVQVRRKPASELDGVLAPGEVGWLLSFDIAASPKPEVRKRYYDDPERPLRQLTVHLNPGGDALMAVRSFDGLRRACLSCRCRFLSDSTERTVVETRSLPFGLSGSEASALSNPIQELRRLVHFPLSELCFRLPVGGAPAEWDLLRVELILDDRWPASVSLSDDSFLLGAVPVENSVRATAEPIEIDGTRLRYPILAAQPATGMVVRDVLGVYLADPNVPGARTALFPNLLVEGGYAVDLHDAEGNAWLEIDGDLDATSLPRSIHVDALWFQPTTEAPSARTSHVKPSEHDLGPIVWRLADPAVSSQRSPLASDQSGLERLLDLHGKTQLSAQEVARLLEILGAGSNEVFSRLPRYITGATSQLLPDGRSQWGGSRTYELELGKVPPVLLAPLRLLLGLLPRALAVWTGESEVVVQCRLRDQPDMEELRLTWRETDE